MADPEDEVGDRKYHGARYEMGYHPGCMRTAKHRGHQSRHVHWLPDYMRRNEQPHHRKHDGAEEASDKSPD